MTTAGSTTGVDPKMHERRWIILVVLGIAQLMVVLDATIGQNALAQAKLFKETMNFTGLVITKLDGTAKGGVVLGICDELQVPVRHIGVGEGIEDLRDFDPRIFCEALYGRAN